jgi:hypothetical protein
LYSDQNCGFLYRDKASSDSRVDDGFGGSATIPFKALTYKIINLPFADKHRLLRGILDGPIIIKPSTLNPHVELDSEDEMMKILEGIEMAIKHNHPLLVELLPE